MGKTQAPSWAANLTSYFSPKLLAAPLLLQRLGPALENTGAQLCTDAQVSASPGELLPGPAVGKPKLHRTCPMAWASPHSQPCS